MKFSQERFVDIGQTLFTSWLKKISAPENITEGEIRTAMNKAANMAFIAAEEFALVFDGQEEKK
jgi:hypothetical protein